MAVKMVLFWISLVICVIGTSAGGEIAVIQKPSSLLFKDAPEIPESFLKEIFTASLGMSIEQSSDWDGLYITDPFNTPEAVVQVYINGVSNVDYLGFDNLPKYSLLVDEDESETFYLLKHRINQRVPGGTSNVVDLKLTDEKEMNLYSDVFGKFNTVVIPKQTLISLKVNRDADRNFLTELENLKTIVNRVKAGVVYADSVIDFYNIHFTSLYRLVRHYDADSPQVTEAKKMLGEVLQDLSSAFSKAYDGSVLITVVASSVKSAHRTQRSVTYTSKDLTDINLAEFYSEEYSVIFNIILWFGIVFVFTLIAIVYAVMDMDPGRDSIIYRMTSTRIKKDN